MTPSPSPLHTPPHPSQVPPDVYVGGGGVSLHMGRWVGEPEEDIGRPEPEGWYLSGGRTMGDGRWGGPDTGGGRMNKHIWTERRKKGKKERGDGQDDLESKAPGRILEGGGRKEPKSSRT